MNSLRQKIQKSMDGLPSYDCADGLKGVYAEDVPSAVSELIGSCIECTHFDEGLKDYCKRLNITASPDWYCADFKRYKGVASEH